MLDELARLAAMDEFPSIQKDLRNQINIAAKKKDIDKSTIGQWFDRLFEIHRCKQNLEKDRQKAWKEMGKWIKK